LISVGTTWSSMERVTDSVADRITFSSILIAARFIGHSAMSLSGLRILMHSFVLITRASTDVQSSVARNTYVDIIHCTVVVSSSSRSSSRSKVLPKPYGPSGWHTDLRFCSPLPDTSLHCETTDPGLMHCVVCLFTVQLKLVLILPTPEGWKAELT